MGVGFEIVNFLGKMMLMRMIVLMVLGRCLNFVQLFFVLPLICHILWFTLGFVDMRSSWPLWIPKVVHWSFFYLEFLIPFLDARSSILMDIFHLYTLCNGSHFSLVVCSLLGRIVLDPFEEIFPEPRLVFREMWA